MREYCFLVKEVELELEARGDFCGWWGGESDDLFVFREEAVERRREMMNIDFIHNKFWKGFGAGFVRLGEFFGGDCGEEEKEEEEKEDQTR